MTAAVVLEGLQIVDVHLVASRRISGKRIGEMHK
jgi:hypothetical protein